MKGLNVIVTGATGMVGEGVMLVCLNHPEVASVLVINRQSVGITHPKLKEIIHKDFYNLAPLESELSGYDACYFCLGVSSIGMDEATYTKLTYTLTIHVAETLARQNKDMVFCYVSGASTDSTEQGKTMWARVKGRTENALMKLPFKKAYAFRPAFMKPMKGAKRTQKIYKYISWMFPIGRALAPSKFFELELVGKAMINVTTKGYEKSVLEGNDIVTLAKQ